MGPRPHDGPSPSRWALALTVDPPSSLAQVRHDVFLSVLTFLYTGTPREIDPETAVEVLGVANLYSIDPLKRICADLITKSISIPNVASVLQAADTYNVASLRTHCISFMVEHFAEVVKSEGFKELISTPTRPLVILFLEEASKRLLLAPHAVMASE